MELWAEPIRMDAPRGFVGWHGYQFERPPVAIRPDHEQPIRAVVLDEPDRSSPRVENVLLIDAVLASRRPNLRVSTVP